MIGRDTALVRENVVSSKVDCTAYEEGIIVHVVSMRLYMNNGNMLAL